jgi:hypothetical protein
VGNFLTKMGGFSVPRTLIVPWPLIYRSLVFHSDAIEYGAIFLQITLNVAIQVCGLQWAVVQFRLLSVVVALRIVRWFVSN